MRNTATNLESKAESWIDDVWIEDGNVLDGVEAERELSDWWTGKTSFTLLMPNPGDGYTWIDGRKTRLQANTKRPIHIIPDEWKRMSKPARDLAEIEGKHILELRRKARESLLIGEYVHPDNYEDYNAQKDIAIKNHPPVVPSPAMPVVSVCQQPHREKLEPHHELYGFVARPDPPSEIKRVPAARAAVQSEWDKLIKKGV